MSTNDFIKVKDIVVAGKVDDPQPQLNPSDQRGLLRLTNDFTIFEIQIVVPDTNAADADKYPVFYLPSAPCFFLEARLRHEVNTSSGTVDIEKLTSGTAKGSGTSVLSSVFSIASGAQTVQRRTATVMGLRTINLDVGDALALKAGGTLTGGSSVTVGILLGMNTRQIPVSANI